MSYLERYIKLTPETAFGSEGENYRAVNYPLRCEMRINETIVEEDIVSQYIDQVSRGARQREITGTLEMQFINPAMLRFSLGKFTYSAVTGSQYYYKFSVIASVPSFTLQKGIRRPTEVATYLGTCPNIHRIVMEPGEDIVQELTIVAKDINYATTGFSPLNIDPSIPYFTSFGGKLTKNTSEVAGLQGITIEINRNLSARWTSKIPTDRTVKEFRPGRCEVTGTFTLDEFTSSFVGLALARKEFTLTYELFKESWNRVIFTIKNAIIPEAPDEIRGREPYELEFPFRAAGSSGLDIMTVEWYYQALPAFQLAGEGANFKY